MRGEARDKVTFKFFLACILSLATGYIFILVDFTLFFFFKQTAKEQTDCGLLKLWVKHQY